MKNGKNRLVLEKFKTAIYTDGRMANICWSPECKDKIRDRVPHHVHSFYEILFVESGTGSHLINGEEIPATSGHLALFAPGSAHDPAGLTGTSVWVLIFNPQVLDTQGWAGTIHTSKVQALGTAQVLLRSLHQNEKHHLLFTIPSNERDILSQLLRQIGEEVAGRQIGWEQMVEARLNVILIGLLRHKLERAAVSAEHGHPVVSQAMDFIDTHFRRQVELSDIAKHVMRSPAYLTNLIKKQTGQSAIAWLSDRRLVEAKSLILTSNKSLQQISEELGYESIRHFSRMFKRQFGDSPMNWRTRIMH